MSREESDTVGRVSKSFGTAGELIIALYDSFPRDYNTKEPLFVIIDELAVPLFCDRFERRGQSKALVVFSDIYTERRASEFIGKELFLGSWDDSSEEEEEEDADEYDDDSENEQDEDVLYLEDLIGYRAQLSENISGTIEDFIDSDNPLFRILLNDENRSEVLIPAVDEFIVQTDLKNKTIHFDLPQGLLELYL